MQKRAIFYKDNDFGILVWAFNWSLYLFGQTNMLKVQLDFNVTFECKINTNLFKEVSKNQLSIFYLSKEMDEYLYGRRRKLLPSVALK